MAKKKSKKRAWTGAPPARPSAASRPATRPGPAGSTSSDASRSSTESTSSAGSTSPAGSVTTEEVEPTPTPTPTPSPSTQRPARPAALAPQPTSNRTARKEEARRQREMLRRKEARRRTMRRYGIIGGIVVLVGAVAAIVLLGGGGGGGPKTIDPRTLPGMTTDTAPWPPENSKLAARLATMGLPPLGAEAQAYHIHQNLAIYINGTKEPVPTGLGLITSKSLAEIHTHDSSGTIHVEAGATRHYTLGTIFDIWGVLLTRNQIGAYKNHGDTRIRVFSNGKPVTGDFAKLPLREQQVIVVTYGTTAQLPNPIPSVYHYAKPPTAPKAKVTPTPTGSAKPSGNAATPSSVPSASPS